MLKNLLFLLAIFALTSLSAQTWDGGGNGSSWDDAENWSNDTIPLEGAYVIFPIGITANVSGSAPNSIDRILFDSMSIVTLDLDLNIGIASTTVHNIVVKKDANVTLGGTTDMRTFNFLTSNNRNSILLNGDGVALAVTEQATLNTDTCANGIRLTKEDATFVNNGTLNLADYADNGIIVTRGTFTNNGAINIGAGMVIEDATSDGITVSPDGLFDNNTEGTITVTKPLDNGLEVLGVFNNAGTVSTVCKDDAISANSGFNIGSETAGGVVNNLASGTINADGGIGGSSRAFAIQALGIYNNAGNINVSNGILGQSFFNAGTLTNETCGHINMIETRILNSNAGVLTNNGLITSSYTAAGVNHGAVDGFALNNAFYGYTNVNSGFAGGNAESMDNGQKTGAGIIVDAENSCTVADIGIDAVYTWYTDSSLAVEAGTNDANGLLALNDGIFAESGMQTLYTCFGEAVQLNIENVSGACALVNGIDVIQLTDVFTLMPNPAQAYTQIEFGDEYIGEKKVIEVYNAVGQLLKTANLNGADNYILDTNNFASGIYMVNLQTEKGMQIERLIVQK